MQANSHSDLIIRNAKPADAEAAALLILSAATDVYPYLFSRYGKRVEEFLLHCLTQDKGLFGHQAHTVAELDGQVVATTSFYSRAEYKQWSDELTPILLKYYGWRTPFMLRRLLRSTDWMVPPARDEWYLANFGVAPKLRSHGIGWQLLEYGLEQARKRDMRIYSLDVSQANPNAERLYRRFGMAEVSTSTFRGAGDAVSDARRLQMLV